MKKSVLFLMVFAGLSHGCYGEDSVDHSGSRDISGYSSSFEMHTNEDGSIAFDEKRTQFDGEKGHTNRRYGRMEFDELVVVANHSISGQQSVDVACQFEISGCCRNAAYCGHCRRYRSFHNGRIFVKLQKNNCLAIIYMRAE